MLTLEQKEKGQACQQWLNPNGHVATTAILRTGGGDGTHDCGLLEQELASRTGRLPPLLTAAAASSPGRWDEKSLCEEETPAEGPAPHLDPSNCSVNVLPFGPSTPTRRVTLPLRPKEEREQKGVGMEREKRFS